MQLNSFLENLLLSCEMMFVLCLGHVRLQWLLWYIIILQLPSFLTFRRVLGPIVGGALEYKVGWQSMTSVSILSWKKWKSTCISCTVRVFKIDAAIRNAFPKCICSDSLQQSGRLLPQIGRLLLRIVRFLPKSTGFKVSKTRCSFAYWSSRAAFVSSGAATERFLQTCVIFEDVYRRYSFWHN